MAARQIEDAGTTDPDVLLAREGSDGLRWVASALRGRLRPPAGLEPDAARLEVLARRAEEWVGDARRLAARVRSRGCVWNDVIAVPIRSALAFLAERGEAGDESAAVLEERLAGIVFLVYREEEEFGESTFHAHTKKTVEECTAAELAKELRCIASSVTLASAIEG
jgi:hypothetical protein